MNHWNPEQALSRIFSYQEESEREYSQRERLKFRPKPKFSSDFKLWILNNPLYHKKKFTPRRLQGKEYQIQQTYKKNDFWAAFHATPPKGVNPWSYRHYLSYLYRKERNYPV